MAVLDASEMSAMMERPLRDYIPLLGFMYSLRICYDQDASEIHEPGCEASLRRRSME